MEIIAAATAILVSYLLGSIPFGFLTARLVRNIDIRKHGSGNIGATNVFRVMGKKWGITVFVLDFFKGFCALLLARFIGSFPSYVFVLAAIVVICGHNWPLFLGFRGGKGVAVSVGAIVGLGLIFTKLFLVLFISFAVWVALFLVLRYVSIASIFSALSFFLFCFVFALPQEVKVFSFIIFVFIIVRHKKNIKNLINKKELRF